MVDLDVATHLQQLVQVLVRLPGVHVDWLIGLTGLLELGSRVKPL